MLCDELPIALPLIELRHGEALWILSHLEFQGDASDSTFYEYIKSFKLADRVATPRS